MPPNRISKGAAFLLCVVENDSNPFRYCGEYFDKETGNIYLRARYYNPIIGRFSTVDPIRDGLNWYAYCYNNPVAFFDPIGLAPGDKFDSPDEAAIDFGKTYNEQSIAEDREYGAVIYKVTVYETKTVTKGFWIFKWNVVEVTDTVVETYYTYSEPRKGTEDGVDFSNVPKSNDVGTKNTEVAQIHTHGRFYYHRPIEGTNLAESAYNGFSEMDINSAKKRKVDTYVVTPWGDMYKGTYKKGYSDMHSPMCRMEFYIDPRIEEYFGEYVRY